MLYLFSKIFFCLALAAGLGGVIGWLLRGSGRRDHLAEIESSWRRRVDTAEKERLALAVERDRLVRENASVKSLHSGCRPRIEALESEIEAAREARALCDEEVTRLKLNLQVLEDRLEPGAEDRDGSKTEQAKGNVEAADPTAPRAAESEKMHDFDLPLPHELKPGKPSQSPAKTERKESDSGLTAASSAKTAPANLLGQPEGEADDLKKIKGIGRVLEKTLNKLGIFHFRQLANLTDGEAAWVAESIKTFPDRIKRDRWVAQAADLHEKKYGVSA